VVHASPGMKDAPAPEERALRGAITALFGLWIALVSTDLLGLVRERFYRAGLFALLTACLVLLVVKPVSRRVTSAILALPRRAFFAVIAVTVVSISLYLQNVALRDQVVVIDSSVYLMEARALASFHFGMPIPTPGLSFSEQFLFEGPDRQLYGVFPSGYPLFLVPFVWLGKPLLAGPFAALLLAYAQDVLARTLTRDELTARLSLLLSIPSWARAMETADLMSHSVVGALAALAVAHALRVARAGKDGDSSWSPALRNSALVIGLAVGWTFAARMLDGLVLAAALIGFSALAVWKRRIAPRAVLVIAACVAPFVALTAAQQWSATGSPTVPSQHEYFARSDYPPTCHRLGLGKDVGCAVEHSVERASFGPDGYDLEDALRLVRERATMLSRDLFGLGPLFLLAFAAALVRPTWGRMGALGFVVSLTLAYGLFYYGNAPASGARHLFPAAPFVWVLAAAFLSELEGPEEGFFEIGALRGACIAGVLLITVLMQIQRWKATIDSVAHEQKRRLDVRAEIDRTGITRGIVVVHDRFDFIAAYDPRADGPDRYIVVDDGSELSELRRKRPDLPVLEAVAPHTIRPLDFPEVPRERLLIELEGAWPSFVRPDRLGVKRIDTEKAVHLKASGGQALAVFVAEPGASLRIPFDVAVGGRYVLSLTGIATPNGGEWEITLDGSPMPAWHSFAGESELRRAEKTAPWELSAGRHELLARCTGKVPESRGYVAAFDSLEGEPVAF
jgi:hypothetical protein